MHERLPMHEDHINLTVEQLIGLFEGRLSESASAWSQVRPALVIVLDELCVFAPKHASTQIIKNYIKDKDLLFVSKHN
jgi:hypothetical protein